ncbi:hypothetical protein [Siphonobacter aquaeclarae]|jgi:hypothetical protein|uniref:Big-1 domain-containing protein n=1 Tax=Siphonobacter aquaeclarae TaxID=563176 RepID=A0A1G9PER1_9BACT|nr:hypothetical protein [Siphonobacter aquaeclarae]MBO9638592.1 hypothetical protein [Siphonobacter aquaeclarae]SDL96697.1 hypothetical protein SAMN04488090_2131 [Siphonobacter aquaeclarae]
MKKILTSVSVLALISALYACEKKDDPFVPRVVAPVLVQILDAPYQSDFASEPAVAADSTKPVTLRARILKLDKTNILDNTKGIDSIPVPNLKISLTFRDGSPVSEGTTDAKGLVTITKTWSELGVTPKYTAPNLKYYKGQRVSLSWSGTYDQQDFTRLSAVTVK